MKKAISIPTQTVEKIQYSFVPNHRETMMALARARLSSQEFRLVVALLNQTDGYLRDRDEISSSFWQAITLMSRASIDHTIKRLLGRGIVTKEITEDKSCYRVNHPNEWAPEVFSAQCISRRSIKLAENLLTKEKNKDNFLWLRRLIKGVSRDEQREKRVYPDTVKNSVSKQTRNEKKRVQIDTVACPNRHDLASPKESTKESVSKESIIGHLEKKKSAPSCRSSTRLKVFQKQSEKFLDWVREKEGISLLNREILSNLVCRAARAARATADDLKGWYLWAKESCSAKDARGPPLMLEQISSTLPLYLEHKRRGKTNHLRRQNERAGKQEERTSADRKRHKRTGLFRVEVVQSGADAAIFEETGEGASRVSELPPDV